MLNCLTIASTNAIFWPLTAFYPPVGRDLLNTSRLRIRREIPSRAAGPGTKIYHPWTDTAYKLQAIRLRVFRL